MIEDHINKQQVNDQHMNAEYSKDIRTCTMSVFKFNGFSMKDWTTKWLVEDTVALLVVVWPSESLRVGG